MFINTKAVSATRAKQINDKQQLEIQLRDAYKIFGHKPKIKRVISKKFRG